MEMIPVSSSDISAIGYNSEAAILQVDFIKSGSYEFHGVPEDVYDGFMAASSKGKYFNEMIKKAGYSYAKL